MSLLLDALKKAADDKQKKVDEPDQAEGNLDGAKEALDISDDSLDLELHPTNESGDPELDESALIDVEDNDVTEPDIQGPDVQEPVVAQTEIDEPEIQTSDNDVSVEKTETKTEDAKNLEDSALEISEQDTNNSQVTPSETLQDIAEDNIHTDSNSSDKNSDDTDNIRLQPLDRNDNKLENTINNEHALSQLINKSNKYSQHQKRRQLIQIAVLITLILIGSGLYFYLQMNTATQDIYISQSNSSNINRETSNRNSQTRPVVDQARPEATVTPVVSTSQAAITKPGKASIKTQAQPAKQTTPGKTTKPIISIVRSKKPDPIHGLLNSAYTAFHQQNYSLADSLYNKVLFREPNNRDALLGLSAIAIKQQRYEVARQKYQFLLRLNPRDSIATAGLSSIKHLINPQLNESKLKFMLKQQPEAAHLYFALGSLYTTQNKWPEAQSAYFSAWSADNKNADYAYNLAVSLDHLDKHKQALDFYQLSLKLSSDSNINFSKKSTTHRINTLQGLSK